MDNSKKILIFGIVSIALACVADGMAAAYFTGIIPAIVAIIFGALAGKEAKAFAAANGGTVYGKAKVGKILGTVGLIVGIVAIVLNIICSSCTICATCATKALENEIENYEVDEGAVEDAINDALGDLFN